MKTLKYIGVGVVLSGLALYLFINWSIDRIVVQNKATACPVWLESARQDGCK